MRLTVAVTRVYATDDQYGAEPRTSLPGTPVTLEDYPGAGSVGEIHFGAVPEEIVEAERGRRAVGQLMLQGLAGQTSDEASPDARFEEAMRGLDEPLFEAHNWYVTLVLRRTIELPDDDFSIVSYAFSREGWLGDDERRAEAKQPLDVLATIISVWDAGLLGNVVLEDRSLFFAEGKRATGAPVITDSGIGATVTRREESVRRFSDQVSLLQGVDLRPLAREGWLAGSAHWRVQSLQETDPWKRFLWSFVGLEVITNKLFERFRSEIVAGLRFADESAAEGAEQGGSTELPLHELVWSPDRTPLAAKFTVVALALFPEEADAEVARFRDLKRARDRLAHGALQEEGEVPVGLAVELLGKVVKAAVEQIVFPSNGPGR